MSFSLRCLLAILAVSGCAFLNPPSPLRPTLAANNCQPLSVTQHNLAGVAHYKDRRLEPAREEFLIAVEEGPTCAEAHYNLGLTLIYMGEKDEARKHFMEAANLAPGNPVIWDSPALRPYGEPQKERKKKETAAEKAPGGFGQRGGMGGGY
ncbi:MAG: tetratricopeptide repeat protein [Nitrospirales bacterium]|nr:tetratricopeptide repeat protein [Nitrospirales bacterium]